jgi:hypothetical protein
MLCPTEDADMEAKEAFYAQINTRMRGVKKQDVIIVMRDLNAK